MDEYSMACRHLGQFFKLAVEYNMDAVDFTLTALNSEYKQGIEIYQPQWYSQSQYVVKNKWRIALPFVFIFHFTYGLSYLDIVHKYIFTSIKLLITIWTLIYRINITIFVKFHW